MKSNRKKIQRSTVQQRLICQVFERSERPLNAEEVLAAAQEKRPSLGIATVYRTIRRMTDEGTLDPVAIAGETTYYETSGKDHHHYFHCCYCRKVFVIGACPQIIAELTPPGFVHEYHDLVLHGYCDGCAVLQKDSRT